MKTAKLVYLLLITVAILAYYKYDLSQAKRNYATAAGKMLHAPSGEAPSH